MSSAIHPSRSPGWNFDKIHIESSTSAHQHVTLSGKSALKQLPEVFERLRVSSSSTNIITHLRLMHLGLTRKQSVGLFAQLGAILASNQTVVSLDLDNITSEKQSSSDALCTLLAALSRNTFLRILIIREQHHPFTSSLVRQIANLLLTNATICELDISECIYVSSQREIIQQALRTNFSLQRLILPNQSKHEDALCEITAMLSQNRILHNHESHTAISLTHRQLSTFPEFILRAATITILRLDHNLLTEIPMEIGFLTSLTQLSLSHNLIRTVCPAVSNLTALVSLNLAHNRLTQLPHFLGWIPTLVDLDIRDNPTQLLPPDLPENPTLLPEYLRQNSFSRTHAFQMKLFFVGTKSSGKTRLMRNLAAPSSDVTGTPKKIGQLKSTSMFSRASITIPGKPKFEDVEHSPITATPDSPAALSLSPSAPAEPGMSWMNKASWEFSPSSNLTAGQTNHLDQNFRLLSPKKSKILQPSSSNVASASIAPVIKFHACDFSSEQDSSQPLFFYFSPRSIYVVVFDLTKEDELRRIDYWLSLIAHLAPQEPIILVGTHADNRRCTRQYIDDFFLNLQDRLGGRFSQISNFLAVSNHTLKGISELQNKIYEIAHARILRESPVPIAFFALREKMAWSRFQDRHEKKSALMSLDDFRHLSSSVNLTSHQIGRALVFLRNCGDVIYIDEEQFKSIIVLDPDRLFQGYAVLLSDPLLTDSGLVSEQELARTWSAAGLIFPTATMIDLLEKFELGYRLPRKLEKNISSVMLRRLTSNVLQNDSSNAIVTKPVSPNSFGRGIILKQIPKILIPALLPLDIPDDFSTLWPEISPQAHQDQIEYARYLYFEFVPIGIFHLLMVRMLHSEWRLRLSWRAGMLLSKKSVLFLLRMHEDRLAVAMRGKDTQCHLELISFLSSIETLFGDWLRIKLVQCKIPCPHCQHCGINPPYLFDLRSVEHSASQGSTVVICRSETPVRIADIAPDVATALINREQLRWDDLSDLEEVARSDSSLVFRATFKGRLVAVKKLNPAAPALSPRASDTMRSSDSTPQVVQYQEFLREAWTLCGLEHPNIINLVGLVNDPPALVMEWADEGSLYSFLHTQPPTLPWAIKLKIAHDIAVAMLYLHSFVPPIIHRDLKSPNCLIFRTKRNIPKPPPITTLSPRSNNAGEEVDDDAYDESYSSPDESDLGSESSSSHFEINRILSQLESSRRSHPSPHKHLAPSQSQIDEDLMLTKAIHQNPSNTNNSGSNNLPLLDEFDHVITKVTDFGLSRQLLLTSTINTRVVDNPTWLAPEVIDGKSYSTKVDVYSYGVILWEILTQQHFFGDLEFQYEIIDHIKAGKRPAIPSNCPARLTQLISDCWSHAPADRPEFSTIISQLQLLASDLGLPEIEIEPQVSAQQQGPTPFLNSRTPASSSVGDDQGLTPAVWSSKLLSTEEDDDIKARLWNEVERIRNELNQERQARSLVERSLAFQILETNKFRDQADRAQKKIGQLESKIHSLQNALVPGEARRRNYLKLPRHPSDERASRDDSERQSSKSGSPGRRRTQTVAAISSSSTDPGSPDEAIHSSSESQFSSFSIPKLPLAQLPKDELPSPETTPPPIHRHRVILRHGESLETALRNSLADLRKAFPTLVIESPDLDASEGPKSPKTNVPVPELMNRMFYGRQALLELMFEFVDEN